MIRTNLSTRPFYNVRAVQLALGALAAIVLLVTVFNVAQIIRLTASQRALGAQAQQAEQEAARLRAEAAEIRQRIDPKELEIVAIAAREANGIIDQRTFSWTNLFTHLEATLPADVRATEITPQRESNVVSIQVQARSVEDLGEFIESLEKTGAFHDVLPKTEVTMENDVIEADIEARYTQATAAAAATAEPAEAPAAEPAEARP
jgi:Tfp pilus assembly protein PilN